MKNYNLTKFLQNPKEQEETNKQKTTNKANDTHKASTYITECWSFVCGFMEVMRVIEVVPQLGTYGHSPHEVRGDFFTADLSLPRQKIFQSTT